MHDQQQFLQNECYPTTVFAVRSLEYYDRFCNTFVGMLWPFCANIWFVYFSLCRTVRTKPFILIVSSFIWHWTLFVVFVIIVQEGFLVVFWSFFVVCFDGYSSSKTVIDYAIFPFSVYFLAYTYIYTPSIFMRHEHRYKHNHAFWVHLLL